MIIQGKHIFKKVTITVLAASLLAHVIVPLSGQVKKAAFTNWLTNNVISSGSESELELRNSIRNLPEQSNDFWVLVKQASELVAANKDDFKLRLAHLPVDGKSDNVTTHLIGQWSIFHSHSTAQNAVIPDVVQTFNKWLQSGSSQTAVLFAPVKETFKRFQLPSFYSNTFIPAIAQIPLVGGISINAP